MASAGAVLIQDGQPIAYSSRSLTDVEGRYAHIEKELHLCQGSDRVQRSQAPRTDYEETTSGSTNAATENDTKPSVV